MARLSKNGLGLLDRLVIFSAWVLSCGLVFVLGYYVGKEFAPTRGGGEGRAVHIRLDPPPAESARAETNFYDQLGRQGGAPRPQPEQVADVDSFARTPTTRRAAPPSTRPAPSPTAPLVEERRPRPTTTVRPRPTSTSTIPARARPASTPTGGWTVYVSPTRDRFEAEAQRAALQARGYGARVVRMQRDGDSWYRVRVGRYENQSSADAVRRELREHGVGHVFVQSE